MSKKSFILRNILNTWNLIIDDIAREISNCKCKESYINIMTSQLQTIHVLPPPIQTLIIWASLGYNQLGEFFFCAWFFTY
jgi:hypothetical protein